MNNSFDPIASEVQMWFGKLKNPATPKKVKELAWIKLHQYGAVDCDSDNCGRCAFHSPAEIAAARAELNEE